VDPNEAIQVSCNHCGAPLRLLASTQFVTCSYCAAPLQVRRDGAAVYTEIMQSIDIHARTIAAHTQEMAQQIKEINLRQRRMENDEFRQSQANNLRERIEAIDDHWNINARMIRGMNRKGIRPIPKVGNGIAEILPFLLIVLPLSAVFASSAPPLSILCILGCVIGIWQGIGEIARARKYKRPRAKYDQMREPLSIELRQLED
jgi:hypothetical protein